MTYNQLTFPKVVNRHLTKLSPWVSITTKDVLWNKDNDIKTYHSLKQDDYVTMFAIRVDGLIPLVRQFRPAIEGFSYEFPGGLIDRDSDPESIATSETFEETGHKVVGKPYFLGCLYPDTGRLENRFWTYFAEVTIDKDAAWSPEENIDIVMVTRAELKEMINISEFNHALHLALISLAITKEVFSWKIV